MKKLCYLTALFAALILLAAGAVYFSERQAGSQNSEEERIVAINEIEQLAKQGDYEKLSEKAAELRKEIALSQTSSSGGFRLFLMCGTCILSFAAVLLYVYFAILRPFEKMKFFAGRISQGDFDVPLDYERSNYFGEFTWAFDSMRCEIRKARAGEREAVENNKTVIATLSHDIKTPVASIRAYAEGLEANLDNTAENRQKYLGVIIRKCDELSKLTDDLFLHSLSDLDKLKISPKEIEITGFMENVISELAAEQNDVCFTKPDFTATVFADDGRMMQIAENLINNARKYAKTNIQVSMRLQKGMAEICFRDFGGGIPDEDMPFLFEKFYRGRNCGTEQGSGLGLYIVRYLTEKMGGNVLLRNHSDGFEAVVSLPVSNTEIMVP